MDLASLEEGMAIVHGTEKQELLRQVEEEGIRGLREVDMPGGI